MRKGRSISVFRIPCRILINYFNVQRIRRDRFSISAVLKQESVESFLDKMLFYGLDKFTKEIFRNKQRTSTRNGILKTEAVFIFANTCKNYHVNFLQDIPDVIDDIRFENDIRSIPGQRSGISLKYFFMLSGSENLIKPDRHILGFIEEALQQKITAGCAQILLPKTCEVLSLKYPHLTPRLLDHTIWSYKKGGGKILFRVEQDRDQSENQIPRDKKVVFHVNSEEKQQSEGMRIGPYLRGRIVLCSADAGPGSQLKTPSQSGWFFPGGKWVGAVRNAAERLRCRFVILTTGHGMVDSHDVIAPYDRHINEYEDEVRDKMNRTIPELIGNDRIAS